MYGRGIIIMCFCLLLFGGMGGGGGVFFFSSTYVSTPVQYTRFPSICSSLLKATI